MLINVEFDDVDAEYDRLVTNGPLEALLPQRSEDFGQRHFIVAGPDAVLIDVITPIRPTGEFSAQFTSAPDGPGPSDPSLGDRPGHPDDARTRS